MAILVHPPSRLDLLAVELVSMIIDNIGLDLISHVAFLRSNDRVGECYRDLDGKFWEPVLRVSGLGRLKDEEIEDDAWCALAILCIEHAERCRYPPCKIYWLQANILYTKRILRTYELDVMEVWDIDDVSLDPPDVINDVWEFIAFKTVTDHSEPDGKKDTVCLRALSKDVEDMHLTEDLEDHPIALRRFATAFPVGSLPLSIMTCVEHVANDHGVTVGDVTYALRNQLKEQLSADEIADLLDRADCFHGTFPDVWTTRDIFRYLKTLRDFFRLVHWTGLSLDFPGGGDIDCEWEFETVSLPDDYTMIRYSYAAPVNVDYV